MAAQNECERAQLETVLTNMAEGLFVSDLKGNILLTNDICNRIFDYKFPSNSNRLRPNLTKPWELRYPNGETIPIQDWPLSRVLRGETLENFEVEVRNLASGIIRQLCYNGSLARDDRHQPLMAILTFHDVTDRKEATLQLAFQAHLLNSVHDAICATDEGFHITYWNEMAEKLFGWTAQEVIGWNATEQIKAIVSTSTNQDALGDMRKTGYFIGEGRFHHKSGREIFTDIHAHVIKGRDGKTNEIIASFRDITERKRHEQNSAFLISTGREAIKLRSNEVIEIISKKIADYFEISGHVALCEVDYAHDEIVVLYRHDTCTPGTEDEPEKCPQNVPQKVQSRLAKSNYLGENLLQALGGGKAVAISNISTDPLTASQSIEHQKTANYAELLAPISIDGRVVFILALQHDQPRIWRPDEAELLQELAGRFFQRLKGIQAAEAQRINEDRFRRIVEATPEGIWTVDSTGITNYVNDRMAQMIGYTPAELMDIPLADLLPDSKGFKSIEQLINNKSKHCHRLLRRKDGSTFPALLSATTLLDSAGKQIGGLIMVSDISDMIEFQNSFQNS
jgi:PAS domain S-box-containing protein